MKLFSSLLKLTEDIVDVATMPVRIAADTTRAVLQPVKKLASEVADEVEDVADQITEDLR